MSVTPLEILQRYSNYNNNSQDDGSFWSFLPPSHPHRLSRMSQIAIRHEPHLASYYFSTSSTCNSSTQLSPPGEVLCVSSSKLNSDTTLVRGQKHRDSEIITDIHNMIRVWSSLGFIACKQHPSTGFSVNICDLPRPLLWFGYRAVSSDKMITLCTIPFIIVHGIHEVSNF